MPLRSAVLALLVTGLVIPRPAPAQVAVPGPRWLTDYGQARQLARTLGKPIFVVFRCEH